MDVPGSDDREENGTTLGHNKGKKGVKNMTSNGITVKKVENWAWLTFVKTSGLSLGTKKKKLANS